MSKKLFAAVLVALFAAGCGAWRVPPPKNIITSERDDRFGTLYIATELYHNLRKPVFFTKPLIVTTFVDLNDFSKSSVFGRMMAERLIDELSKQGFKVLEVRRAQDFFIKNGVGELVLTREAAELDANANATARTVLAGTYVATDKRMIINARLIDTRSPQVVSTVSFEVDLTRELEDML